MDGVEGPTEVGTQPMTGVPMPDEGEEFRPSSEVFGTSELDYLAHLEAQGADAVSSSPVKSPPDPERVENEHELHTLQGFVAFH